MEVYTQDFDMSQSDVGLKDKKETVVVIISSGCASSSAYINELNKKNKTYVFMKCENPANKPFLLKLKKQLGLTTIQVPMVLKFKNGFLVNRLSNKLTDI